MRRENFEVAAQDLFDLLVSTQEKFPNQPRKLFLDIDGHRNEKGGFNRDMLELQKEFLLGFLLPYFNEISCPLITVENIEKQKNDIPDKLQIFNKKEQRGDELYNLYLENHSNTEFISKESIYQYLNNLSKFLKNYNELDGYYLLIFSKKEDKNQYLLQWRNYIKNLVNELFNSFIHGNLLSASAMTRTLIESYIYLGILINENNPALFRDWFLCSMFIKMKQVKDWEFKDELSNTIKKHCQTKNLDYEVLKNKFKSANSWLGTLLGKKKVHFEDACDYLNEKEAYEDFQDASTFIHGQDAFSKLSPFTFYEATFNKLDAMVHYIFQTIQLFPLEKVLLDEVHNLEIELDELRFELFDTDLMDFEEERFCEL